MRRIGKACMGLLLALLALLSCLPGMARAQFDPAHAVWDGLLRKHVVPVDGGHATRVNYRGMAADRKALQAYLGELSRVSADDYARWTRDRKLAFLINAYNAFTVEKVLMRYPDLKSIRDFGIIFGNPWKDDFFTLLGLPQNLDGLEHGLIRAPGVFDDPRIHFAVNCAAVGCPALRGEAYVAARLDAQLDAQALRFLADRSRNRHAGNALEVSRIFDWYGGDFAAGHRGINSVAQYLARHAHVLADREADRQAVRGAKLPIRFLDYDWRLNDVAR